MAINGQIVDEINGLIASRDSIRTTMKAAGIASDTSKLADLATSLAAAKLPASEYTVSASDVITIPRGKLTTGDQTITVNSLASQTPGTAAAGDIRSGKTAWVGGNKVTGSMPNATITSGSATISSVNYTYNDGSFRVTGSADVSAPSVGTAGYISSTVGTRNKNTASVSATVAKIAGNINITGMTTPVVPSISRQSLTIPNVTDAASGNATTTAPTSGVWVKVKSAVNTGRLTTTLKITTDGYGTNTYHGITPAVTNVGAEASADTYIPIKNGAYSASVSTSAGSASMSATGVSTTSSSNCYITLSTSAGSATGKATIGTAGWIAAGSTSSSKTSVSVSGNGTKLYLATYTPSTITVTNISQTLLISGKVCTENITIPAVNYYYTNKSAPSSTSGYNDGDVWLVTV